MFKKIIIVFIALAGLLTLAFVSGMVYILPEGRQAIVTEFGKPIGDPITTPGVKFKKPFIQDLRVLEKRILSWDGYPNQIPTRDKKYISVDTTARWKISNALTFLQTVQSERGAKDKLDAIIDSATRDIISAKNLVEAVRNTNNILTEIEERRTARDKRDDKTEEQDIVLAAELDEEFLGNLETVELGREKLSSMIIEESNKQLSSFGIEVIDVQLRRISYEESVEKKVYERMISERLSIAEKIRSLGQGEKAKIQGRLDKDLQGIQAAAYRRAQKIRGEAEAKSIKIYADQVNRDPGFYEFTRSMEAYKNSLKKDSKLILTSDSEFLKYLKKQ